MVGFLKFIFSLLFVLITAYSFAQHPKTAQNSIQHINPPLQQFYSKYLDNEGIPIRASDIVSDSAFLVASQKITMLLKLTPEIRKNLITNSVEFHIIGRNQVTSDLPEFRASKGIQYTENGLITDIDKRTRGMGGIFASCGEENLLGLSGDKYGDGYDIFVHEFAHSIMDFGMDSILRNKIIVQYKSSMAKGLWKGVYASTNEQEYWAELSNWYFGAHGDRLADRQPADGPLALKAYDPFGYQLLDSIYTGKLKSALIVKKSRIVTKGTHSEVSTQTAKIIVTNNSKKSLRIFKIDEQGNSIFVEDVLPSSIFQKDTLYSIVWLIEGGQTPIYVQVFDPVCYIELSKDY